MIATADHLVSLWCRIDNASKCRVQMRVPSIGSESLAPAAVRICQKPIVCLSQKYTAGLVFSNDSATMPAGLVKRPCTWQHGATIRNSYRCCWMLRCASSIRTDALSASTSIVLRIAPLFRKPSLCDKLCCRDCAVLLPLRSGSRTPTAVMIMATFLTHIDACHSV